MFFFVSALFSGQVFDEKTHFLLFSFAKKRIFQRRPVFKALLLNVMQVIIWWYNWYLQNVPTLLFPLTYWETRGGWSFHVVYRYVIDLLFYFQKSLLVLHKVSKEIGWIVLLQLTASVLLKFGGYWSLVDFWVKTFEIKTNASMHSI